MSVADLVRVAADTGKRAERPLTPAELSDGPTCRLMGRTPTRGNVVAARGPSGRVVVTWSYAAAEEGE